MQGTSTVRAWRAISASVLGMLLVVIGACSGPVRTDDAVVVRDISVSPSVLQQGQVAIVEVLVTNGGGDPLPNRTVYLTANPNTGGTFANSVIQTDENGVAAVVFTATQTGTVTISARAEGAPATINASVIIENNSVVNENGQIVLAITPLLIQADGVSNALVNATVANAQGNPMPDSTAVKFTAGEKFVDRNGDGFWTVNVDSLVYDYDADDQWDQIGTIDNVAYTSGGIASAVYTAGYFAGLVYIKATLGDPGHQVSQDISLSLTSNDSIYSISLTPDWQRIQVRGTGGIEWVRLLAEGFDENGNRAPEGLALDFNITAGPGGGEAINGDPIGPVTVFTNSLGQAWVTLNAGTISGTVRIRARAGTVVSAATQITIRSGPPAFISVGAVDCNVPSWELVNVTNRLTAVVVDQWGNEVPDSTSVWFGTEQGLVEGADETRAALTFRGVAETFWHSGAPKNDGYVIYWCETAGGTVADTSAFIESGPAAYGAFLTWPDTLYADGASHGEVVIEVLDVNGVFMDSDTPMDVKTNLGSIPDGLINDGCHSSIYVGEFFAPVLDRDHEYTIPDNGIGGIAVISARAGGYFGFNETVEIVLRTGRAFTANSSVRVATSIPYGITVPVEVTIKDRWGNPLGGHLIDVRDDGAGGAVFGSPRYTDEYGVAGGYTFTATNNQNIKSSFISVYDLDPNYGGVSFSVKISFEE